VRLILWAAVVCASAAAAEGATKKAVRVYTNEDLDRYAGRREEPSVAGLPAPAPPEPDRPPERGERYWRHEAERVRERTGVLRAEVDLLRARLTALREASRTRPLVSRRRGDEPNTAELESRLRALQARIGALQADLEERARRAGALPGWLR
jgi:DNA repair exonuclease SbcCD ATPase subunit